MNFKSLDDGSVLYFDSNGVMQVHDFGRGVSLHVRRGIMTLDFARHVIEDGERQIRNSGRYVLMVDGSETKMHTTDFREIMTSWFRDHETAVVHMLIRSRMLEMALNVANLMMGNARAKAYFKADIWESVGRQEVPSFVKRPLAVPSDVRVARDVTAGG
jgi:hypothetical protein